MRALAAVMLVVLTACASANGDDLSTASPGATVTGTLGGDPALEGGCAWLDTPQGRYQVIYPEGYEVTFEPLRLEGPDGIVAAEGDSLTVHGEESDALVSVCQVGTLFTATHVTSGG